MCKGKHNSKTNGRIMKKMTALMLFGVLILFGLCSCGSSNDVSAEKTPKEQTTESAGFTVDFNNIEGHYEYSADGERMELDIRDEAEIEALLVYPNGEGAMGKVDEAKKRIVLHGADKETYLYFYEFINNKLVLTENGKDKPSIAYEKKNTHKPILKSIDDCEGQTFYLLTDSDDISGSVDITDDDRVLLSYSDGTSYKGTVDTSGEVAWDDGYKGKLSLFNDKIAYTDENEDSSWYVSVFAKENYFSDGE